MVAILWATKNYYGIIKLSTCKAFMCFCFSYPFFFLFFSHHSSAIKELRRESLGDCVSFRGVTQTKTKDLVHCSYCLLEHPPTVSFSQWTGPNMHHITNYRASIKWFNHSVLVIMQNWQKVFLLLLEIADTPLGELNKDTVLRGMLRNLTNENIRQQKSAHVQRKVTTTSVTAFSENLGWLIKCSHIF